MGWLAEVLSFVRVARDGVRETDVEADPGGDAVTTPIHYAPIGDDAHALPGDIAAVVDVRGAGRGVAVAYAAPDLEPLAEPGEKRIYARNTDREVTASVWLRADGSIEIHAAHGDALVKITSDGDVQIQGATALALAPKVDAEIKRIWTTLTTWPVAAYDGGGALQTQATADSASVKSVAASKVFGS